MFVKTDSFVVESNVHFPTDYNLLWDSSRNALDVVEWFKKKNPQVVMPKKGKPNKAENQEQQAPKFKKQKNKQCCGVQHQRIRTLWVKEMP